MKNETITLKQILIEDALPLIKDKIEAKGLTQSEVAEIIGWRQSTVSRFLNMTRKTKGGRTYEKEFTSDSIYFVAGHFGVDINMRIRG